MTREDAIEQLKFADNSDIESGHWRADEILCKLLISLGYQDVVDEWEKVRKWYA